MRRARDQAAAGHVDASSEGGNYGTPILDTAGVPILDTAGVSILDTAGPASEGVAGLLMATGVI